jgi:hypothetical protein
MKVGACASIFIFKRRHKQMQREGGIPVGSASLHSPLSLPTRNLWMVACQPVKVDHFSTPMVDHFSLPIDSFYPYTLTQLDYGSAAWLFQIHFG